MILSVKRWFFLDHSMTLLPMLIATFISASVACNPDFCISRAHGAYFCDPADSASYYRCVFEEAHHFTCGPGTVYDGSICNLPHAACITNPVPDPSPGEVVNGICVATAGSTTTGTATTGSTVTETTGSAVPETSTGTSGTTPPQNTEPGEHGVLWQQYRRHLHMKSECAVTMEFQEVTPMSCASKCTISGNCTGFNLYIDHHDISNTLQYVCQLIACPSDHLLAPLPKCAFYDQI